MKWRHGDDGDDAVFCLLGRAAPYLSEGRYKELRLEDEVRRGKLTVVNKMLR
ncbi:hypothetical protein QJS10_CPB21g00781 [Acorus calamus]|uniref:Uncharacterized protein n=1 Tax=Acorus calamus TaxID=4465 RepID=A0AAV9C7U3_ACOCL|nr:hypothetical protein QJS10_CPB21g00781 [Acorus calamus]